jgi:drug/metabolite transporter (DMT)-like permease
MTQRLTPATASLLVIPPMLWAGNAVVGRLVTGLVPPMTLNFLRWALAFVILLPLAWRLLRNPAAAAVAALAALRRAGPAGRGLLQRAAIPGAEDLDTAQRDAGGLQRADLDAGGRRAVLRPAVSKRQVAGAVLSIAGVLVVLSRGQWRC